MPIFLLAGSNTNVMLILAVNTLWVCEWAKRVFCYQPLVHTQYKGIIQVC